MAGTAHDLVHRLFDEGFNQRDYGALDDVIADDFVEHAISPFGAEAPGAVRGPEHMRGVVDYLVGQYPDLQMTIEALVGEGDTVAARVSSTGTNLGPINGVIPPTGRVFSGEQSHWYRIEAGKLAEHWAVRDDLRTMMQLGLIAPPGPPGA